MGGCFRRERNWGELGPVSLHVSLRNIQMSCPKVRRTVRVKRFCRKGGMRRERPCIIRVKKKKEREMKIYQ